MASEKLCAENSPCQQYSQHVMTGVQVFSRYVCALQGTTATVGSSLQGPVPAAPTLVANVSAAGDGTGQAVHLVTPATVVATPTAQLPATVQVRCAPCGAICRPVGFSTGQM